MSSEESNLPPPPPPAPQTSPFLPALASAVLTPCANFSPQDVASTIALQFDGCQPKTDSCTELHRAASQGDLDQLMLQINNIKSGVSDCKSINQRDHMGCTALRLAAAGMHFITYSKYFF